MLGMAASNSMAVPSGRRSHPGDNSVRKMAMPKLTGTAMTRAMMEVINVPYIGIRAPNRSIGGFHSLVQRNAGPNFTIVGHEA